MKMFMCVCVRVCACVCVCVRVCACVCECVKMQRTYGVFVRVINTLGGKGKPSAKMKLFKIPFLENVLVFGQLIMMDRGTFLYKFKDNKTFFDC